MFVNAVNQSFFGCVSLFRGMLYCLFQSIPLSGGFAGIHQKVDAIKSHYRARVQKKVQRKDHQEQPQRHNITLFAASQVIGGQDAGIENQGFERAENLGVKMRELMQSVMEEVLEREIVSVRRLLPAFMAVFPCQDSFTFGAALQRWLVD